MSSCFFLSKCMKNNRVTQQAKQDKQKPLLKKLMQHGIIDSKLAMNHCSEL